MLEWRAFITTSDPREVCDELEVLGWHYVAAVAETLVNDQGVHYLLFWREPGESGPPPDANDPSI